MLHALLLAADAPAGSEAPFGMSFMPIILMLIVGYFLLLRPMKQQEKQRQALISTLKKNDKVITSGGIIGIVANIKEKEDEVALKVDENSNVRIRVTKSSIVRVISADEVAKEPKTEG